MSELWGDIYYPKPSFWYWIKFIFTSKKEDSIYPPDGPKSPPTSPSPKKMDMSYISEAVRKDLLEIVTKTNVKVPAEIYPVESQEPIKRKRRNICLRDV